MELLIDGGPIPPEAVRFSELGFGQRSAGGDRYELRVPIGEFVERFGSIYEDTIEELRADDRVTGEFKPQVAGATDYLPLPELLRIGGAALEDFVVAFLKFDIFAAYFSSAGDGGRFALISLERVVSDGETVVLTGSARALAGA